MPYPYLGKTARTYPQYRDAQTGSVLRADPGGSYDIEPAGALDVAVPPGDGLWGAPPEPLEPAVAEAVAAEPALSAPEAAAPVPVTVPASEPAPDPGPEADPAAPDTEHEGE